MSTFMANKGNIVRKWYILDAAGKPLGKTAAAAATLLRGKHKPEFIGTSKFKNRNGVFKSICEISRV